MITLSASKISTYLSCGRKFKFRYVWKIPAQWKAAALAFGSAVHGALETFHEQRVSDGTMSPEATAGLFRIDWAAEQVDDLKFKEGESAEDLGATGAELVRQYALANQSLEVVAVESAFELLVADGIVLRGVFDALLAGDRVRELKTAARNYDEGTLARHVQLSAYAWAYREIYDREPVLEVVAMLKLKHPRIAIHEVTRTLEDDEWFVELVVEVARAIQAEVYPANPSWACSDCEYGQACRGGP